MTRFGWIFGALLLTVAFAASAKPLGTKEALQERTLGDPKAPITIIEYSSLGCPHCARFHKETLPEIKKNYIDTGKAVFVCAPSIEPRRSALKSSEKIACAPWLTSRSSTAPPNRPLPGLELVRRIRIPPEPSPV